MPEPTEERRNQPRRRPSGPKQRLAKFWVKRPFCCGYSFYRWTWQCFAYSVFFFRTTCSRKFVGKSWIANFSGKWYGIPPFKQGKCWVENPSLPSIWANLTMILPVIPTVLNTEFWGLFWRWLSYLKPTICGDEICRFGEDELGRFGPSLENWHISPEKKKWCFWMFLKMNNFLGKKRFPFWVDNILEIHISPTIAGTFEERWWFSPTSPLRWDNMYPFPRGVRNPSSPSLLGT